MNRTLRNLGIALTAICATTVIGNAGRVYAGSTTNDVYFDGTVTSACSFSGNTSGTLVPDPGAAYRLQAGELNGTAGTLTINCNATATVTIEDPVKMAGPNLSAGSVAGSWLDVSGTDVVGSPQGIIWYGTLSASRNVAANTTESYGVHMRVENGNQDPLQSGAYQFKTTVTATY